MEEETVTISLREYEGLLECELWTIALEGAGVDNWEGYSYALKDFEKMKRESEEKQD